MDNHIMHVRYQDLSTEKQALRPTDFTREVELTDTDLEAVSGAADPQDGTSQTGTSQGGDLQGELQGSDLQGNLQGTLQQSLLADLGPGGFLSF